MKNMETKINESEDEIESEIEFMRKLRFDKIRDKFSDVSPKADEVIKNANPDDILALTLTFNSPIKVIKAEIFDDKKFIDLAF